MTSFEKAWNILKDDESMTSAKKKLIDCLKKEGGAAGLDMCCKATGMEMDDCKKLINSMDNVKMHKHGDVILMDGL